MKNAKIMVYGEDKSSYMPQYYTDTYTGHQAFFENIDDAKKFFGDGYTVTPYSSKTANEYSKMIANQYEKLVESWSMEYFNV